MLPYFKAVNWLFSILIFGFMAIVVGCVHKTAEMRPLSEQIVPYSPLITEISPQASEKEGPWIELHNPLRKEIDASNLILVINDTFRYALPSELASLPSQTHVVIKLDGKDSRANDYNFKEKKVVLHPGPKSLEFMKGHAGQIAVYKKNKNGQEELVDFVSWGAPASFKSLTPERNQLWEKKWFVKQVDSFGDYDVNQFKEIQNYSIGRYPGRTGSHFSDWVVFYGQERTPGSDNSIPAVRIFTLSNDATVRSEDIAVGWTCNKYAKQFKFQIARDALFKDIVEDLIINQAYYKPKNVLPEGSYYYRVKIIDSKGRESVWSKTMKVHSKRMGAMEDGAITAEVLLTDMQYRRQRKDTNLLCLDGCASHLDGATIKHWDNVHPDAVPVVGDHGDMNCVRASIAMMVSFYGRNLSQDRIAYFTEEERAGVGNGIPEGDLAHSVGMSYSAEETAALEWALDETITDFFDTPNPSFNDLKGWLDANRPIMTRTPGHMRTMNGYREEDNGTEWVHILDPWSGERWETYATWNAGGRGTWVGPVSAPNARENEPEITADTDNDAVMDFDERVRFITGLVAIDTDHDEVDDKEDIYEYVYQFGDVYAKRDADFDADGVRKENDPDNDADTFNDGCEDKNGNGIYEAASGDTDNFFVDAGLTCGEKQIHAIIVFDRSGSMVYPASDPVKKYDRAADAATLFLDAWLANDPPEQTKAGLVYYDNTAYFDSNTSTNTTLEILDEAKRDKIVDSFPLNQPNYGSTSIGGGILEAMGAQGFDIAGIPADDQHRVIIVLTDGMENAGTRMDSPIVTQSLTDGEVDGYVLGIGDETQIDEDKLNTLADILNHPPASFAKDLDAFQLEKFFLQVLSETQGMEFSMDPVSQINIGETKTHTVSVNPGAERVTFIVVWNEPNGKIEFTLMNPNGQAVNADVTKTHGRYQIATKISPNPGQWTLNVEASALSSPAPAVIHYSLMAMEKNTSVSAKFHVLGTYFQTGDSLRLVADLSREKHAVKGGQVMVKVEHPTLGLGTFKSKAQVRIPATLPTIEKGIKVSPLDKKYQIMALEKTKVPITSTVISLNDQGKDGDEIPGDGKYTGIFDQTKYDGLYTFHFIANALQKSKISTLNREKVLTVHVKPKIHPQKSLLSVIHRDYRAIDKQTYIKLTVTPRDRFGNEIGPGNASILEMDVKNGRVIKVVDKLNGSYDLEMMVPGNYQKEFVLKPAYRRYEGNGK